MSSTFHLRRLLYAFVFLGFVYVGIQIARTQMGYGFIDDLDRNARLGSTEVSTRRPSPGGSSNSLAVNRTTADGQSKQISVLLDSSSGAVWKKLAAGGQACRHPYLEVRNREIMRFMKDVGPIKCSDVQDWVEVDGSTMRITDHAREQFGSIECDFTDILRGSDHNTHDGLTTRSHTEYNLVESDFVKIYCKSEKGDTWTNVMAGIRHDQDVVDRTGWDKVPKDALRLNVLMWGFDSLSRNMFIRKLPRAYHYLRETLGSIELQGYNIVGDGTPQALIPILTGKTELELPETRKRMGDKATFVNVYPFVWKEFQENGYVTGFHEDCPSIGAFTYRLKGFDSPPTDHYMRSFYLEAAKTFNKNKKLCLGSIPRHKVLMNYVHDFFKVYREKPKFLFSFHGELSHDSYNSIGAADQDMLEWLQTMNEEGHLNNTLLIVMSDHGHRFTEIRNTQQGKQEERLPMFSFVFPSWFMRSHPEAIANLRRNMQRLTSPFDIHPTLQNLLHYEGSGKGDIHNRSISLFKEIPLERTCADAYIETHWCACLDWQAVSLSDSLVQRGAHAVVEYINKYNQDAQGLCDTLRLNQVQWAAKLVPTKGLLQFRKNADMDGFVADLTARTDVSQEVYQLKISTMPGNGLFEVSLTYDVKDNSFTIRASDISRINKYGSDAHCIVDTQEQLRKFCHCKSPPPKEHK